MLRGSLDQFHLALSRSIGTRLGEFPRPLDARELDAKVILGKHFKIKGFLGQHHLLALDALQITSRRGVGQGVHPQAESGLPGKPVLVRPRKWNLKSHLADLEIRSDRIAFAWCECPRQRSVGRW